MTQNVVRLEQFVIPCNKYYFHIPNLWNYKLIITEINGLGHVFDFFLNILVIFMRFFMVIFMVNNKTAGIFFAEDAFLKESVFCGELSYLFFGK